VEFVAARGASRRREEEWKPAAAEPPEASALRPARLEAPAASVKEVQEVQRLALAARGPALAVQAEPERYNLGAPESSERQPWARAAPAQRLASAAGRWEF
jgi:hypothetical protein